MIFKDRVEAGEQLAKKLASIHPDFIGNKNVVVLGIVRGGVAVAWAVAGHLNAPLDVVVVRKLGVPYHPEFAFGAIDPSGGVVINHGTVSSLGLGHKEMEEVKKKELAEARRRVREFRGGRGPIDLKGRIVIVVDDGIATGATAEAAVRCILSKDPIKVVLAVPVIAADTLRELNSKFENTKEDPSPPQADDDERKTDQDESVEIICLDAPKFFAAVGQFYINFPQVNDEEVKKLLS